MVVFWFLLALVLLAVALVLLRLDAGQRGGAARRDPRPAAARGSAPDEVENDDDNDYDDDAFSGVPSAEDTARMPAVQDDPAAPRLAPFQRATATGAPATAGDESEADEAAEAVADEAHTDVAYTDEAYTDEARTDEVHTAAPGADGADSGPADSGSADSSTALRAGVDEPGAEPEEPTAVSAPRLLDKVRAFLPARRQSGRRPEPAPQVRVDPLADSPVVRWLEDREFEPTPTPAPEFVHGDFAGGLSALGTVSHGMFRGRRAIMGVTGGRTVLALRRDTASDVVLDLSRADVDAEPGFHDAGEVAALEARTSDFGRLDLIDRDRLADAVHDVPQDVRRIWAEGEWVAATIDGVDDPSTWDDVVVALHRAADVLAPFPPIGGRARALPAEIDPGAPGAADGPEADPSTGMDGEVGTGTHSTTPAPAVAGPATSPTAGDDDELDAVAPGESGAEEQAAAAPEPRRAGHLRLVPDRSGVRDLTDAPVVADRGDADAAGASTPAESTPAEPEPETAPAPEAETEPEPEPETEPEPDPFAEIMEPSGPVPSRGDVAADFLPSRPPLSRPTRGVGQAFPEDASVPPLAAGSVTGGTGIKPIGSEDDEDEIRTEVERFDAARIDGGSDLDRGAGGRHGSVTSEEGADGETGRLTVADLAAKVGATPSSGQRHRRRADPDEHEASEENDTEGDAGAAEADNGRERPGIDPDLEQTTRIQMPPDIRD